MVAVGYDKFVLQKIIEEFWGQSYSSKIFVFRGNLQGRLGYLVGLFFLAKEEFQCFAELLHLQFLMFNNKSPNFCPVLLYIMSNDKTNQKSRIKYNGVLKHKDLLLCYISALAIYFLEHWKQSGKQISTFENNNDWYSLRVVISIFLNIYLLN